MVKYKARDILQLSTDELWALPDGHRVIIQFDDGDFETTVRRTIFSAYLWEYHRLYPEVPLFKRHHIGEKRLGKDTHLNVLNQCLWDTYEATGRQLDLGHLTKLAYEITNRLYNDMTYRLEPHVSSVSILDFVDVMDNPKIKEANAEVKPFENSITATYSTIESVLKDEAELPDNPVADAAKSGLVSMGQILQCVGPRGYLTDIDSTVFRRPVLVGYVEGMRSLHDVLIESRSAAKATSFARDYVSAPEYFNRLMQLLCETVKRVHGVSDVAYLPSMKTEKKRELADCGSTHYRPVRVRSSDLKLMAGKYYLAQDNTLKALRADDRHLIGEVIQVRSIFDCQLKDREGFCATCYGELALSVPGLTNIGHLCATLLCEMVSQAVLSTKHLDQSSTIDELPLNDFERNYLRLGADRNHVSLASKLKNSHVKMIVASNEAPHLSDINYVEDVSEFSVSRISEISDIALVISSKTTEDVVTLPVSVGSRKSSMSHKLLDHIKRHGWSLTDNGDYLIDLKGWDVDDTLLTMALRQMNMLDFMKRIEQMVKGVSGTPSRTRSVGSREKNKTVLDFNNPWAALLELYELVSSKLSVNVAHLEVIIKATMIVSSKDYNYNLPLANESSEFAGYEKIMSMRSLTPRLAYKFQQPELYSPRSYVFTNRPAHLLDAVLSN